jgi:hypothetical protein
MEPALRTSARKVAWNASSASCSWAQQPAADGPDHRAVAPQQGLEGGLVPLPDEAPEQFAVGRGR